MPLSSLQGCIYGVSWKALPAPALPRVIEKLQSTARIAYMSKIFDWCALRTLHRIRCRGYSLLQQPAFVQPRSSNDLGKAGYEALVEAVSG